MRNLILSILVFVSTVVFAHEGDHGVAQVQAPKGGIIRSLETIHLELLAKGKDVQIFVYDINAKPGDVSKYPVSATLSLPKKPAQSLVLTPKGDHWAAEVDAKGAHRYTIELSIEQGGHKDKVKFTVEPKK